MSPYGVRPLWLLYSTPIVLQRARNARILLKNSLIFVLSIVDFEVLGEQTAVRIPDRDCRLISFLAPYQVRG